MSHAHDHLHQGTAGVLAEGGAAEASPVNTAESPRLVSGHGNNYRDTSIENSNAATAGNRHVGEEHNVAGPRIEVTNYFGSNGEVQSSRGDGSVSNSRDPATNSQPSTLLASRRGVGHSGGLINDNITSVGESTTTEGEAARVQCVEDLGGKKDGQSERSDGIESYQVGRVLQAPAEHELKEPLRTRIRRRLNCFGTETKRRGKKSRDWVRERKSRFLDITFKGQPFVKISWGRRNSCYPASTHGEADAMQQDASSRAVATGESRVNQISRSSVDVIDPPQAREEAVTEEDCIDCGHGVAHDISHAGSWAPNDTPL